MKRGERRSCRTDGFAVRTRCILLPETTKDNGTWKVMFIPASVLDEQTVVVSAPIVQHHFAPSSADISLPGNTTTTRTITIFATSTEGLVAVVRLPESGVNEGFALKELLYQSEVRNRLHHYRCLYARLTHCAAQ